MLQQSGQIPLGVFDTNAHQNVPGSFEAGKGQMTLLRHTEAL